MTLQKLHDHLKASLNEVVPLTYGSALRVLLEAGGSERFLMDLLFLRLVAAGEQASREFPLGRKDAADIRLHGDAEFMIEAKQFHLKDGCKYLANLAADLRRHGRDAAVGIAYVLDERASSLVHCFPAHFPRYGGANRKAKFCPADILAGLSERFAEVEPPTCEAALCRRFADCGGLDLYGFVVAGPAERPARSRVGAR